jgi:hypothetical protein
VLKVVRWWLLHFYHWIYTSDRRNKERRSVRVQGKQVLQAELLPLTEVTPSFTSHLDLASRKTEQIHLPIPPGETMKIWVFCLRQIKQTEHRKKAGALGP